MKIPWSCQRRKVALQGVLNDNFDSLDCLADQSVCEPLIPLDGDDSLRGQCKLSGQVAKTRSDFQDRVVRAYS